MAILLKARMANNISTNISSPSSPLVAQHGLAAAEMILDATIALRKPTLAEVVPVVVESFEGLVALEVLVVLDPLL
eukprot:588913-Pyramimonas_sp.AAC.1